MSRFLPWPSPGCLDLEREAQEGADEDDRGQHCHAGQTRRGGASEVRTKDDQLLIRNPGQQ